MKNTIRVQRAIREITQDELAQALGVARITINAVELRKFIPSSLLVFRLAKYFNIPVEELFMLEEGEMEFYEIKGK